MAQEHPELVGQKFGKLTVLELSHVNKAAHWKCVCECGKFKIVRTGELRSGYTQHCGCSRKRKHKYSTKSSECGPTYRCWFDMMRRCYNPKCKSYRNYGAKGVEVTKRWRGKGGFDRFVEDMGLKPPGLTLERKNPFGDYQKSNCRWATRKEQSLNKRKHWIGKHRIG